MHRHFGGAHRERTQRYHRHRPAQRLLQEQSDAARSARLQDAVRHRAAGHRLPAARAGVNIVFIKDNFLPEEVPIDKHFKIYGPHCIMGTPDAEIVDELDPKPGDFQIRKKHYSAFNSTRLDAVLRELDVKRLYFTGAWTEACVQHTVIDAFYLNYEINVLSDAVSSPHRDAHEYALNYMRQYHRANIITSDQAIAQFRAYRPSDGADRRQQSPGDRLRSVLYGMVPCVLISSTRRPCRPAISSSRPGRLRATTAPASLAEARIDPAFPYYGSSIKRQTRYILQKLDAKFKAAGTSLEHAVKAHVFHTDLRNFDAFDEAWREFFPNRPPCRATVGMGETLVPGCLVQVDLVAAMPSTPVQVFTSTAPRAPVNYSEVDDGRRFRVRGRTDGERLQDRRAGRRPGPIRRFRSTGPTSRSRPATS